MDNFSSVAGLKRNGDWYSVPGTGASNAWTDRDDSGDGTWPIGGTGIALTAAWTDILQANTDRTETDERWVSGLNLVTLFGSKQTLYEVGLAVRIDILMAQVKAANCIFNLISFDGVLFA